MNSLLGAFQLRNNIAVPVSPLLLCNLLVTYSNTRFAVSAKRFISHFFFYSQFCRENGSYFLAAPDPLMKDAIVE